MPALTEDIKIVVREHIKFCKDLPEEKKFEYILNHVINNYDLGDDKQELELYIKTCLTKGVVGKSNKKEYKQNSLPHYGQLIVPRWQLRSELADVGLHFAEDLLYCISNGPKDPEYKLSLLSASSRLYNLSRLIYKSKGTFTKLPPDYYEKHLFEDFMETKEEVADRLKTICRKPDEADSDTVFRCVEALKPLITRWASCLYEQIYIYEYAFFIDYVIKRNGDVPYPENGLFPRNYEGFNYTEGIGEEFNRFSY